MQLSRPDPAEAMFPTTAAARPPAESVSARDVAAQFEALLLRAIFAPLSASLGFYGDAVAGEAARAIAVHERGGLTDALVRSLGTSEP